MQTEGETNANSGGSVNNGGKIIIAMVKRTQNHSDTLSLKTRKIRPSLTSSSDRHAFVFALRIKMTIVTICVFFFKSILIIVRYNCMLMMLATSRCSIHYPL